MQLAEICLIGMVNALAHESHRPPPELPMTSTFDRRKSVSAHHELWIELGHIDLAIEQSQLQDGDTSHHAPLPLLERQLQLREALAKLDS